MRSRRGSCAYVAATAACVVLAVGALSALGCASGGGGASSGGGAIAGVGGEGESSGRRDFVRPVASYRDAVVRTLLREAALEELEAATASESALLRANALEALQTTPTRGREAAVAGLGDENPGVRFVAAMSVGRLRATEAVPLLRQLLEDPDPRVRMAAIYALNAMERSVDQTPLGQYVRSSDPSVQRQAVFVLGEIGNPSAAPMLREASARPGGGSSDGRATVHAALLRLHVAEALLKLGDQDVESVLRSALFPGTRDEVEAAILATQVIGRLGLESATSQLVRIIEQPAPGSSATADVRQREYLWPRELRLAAAYALAQMGEFGGVFTADLYVDDPDPLVRSQAAFVYGEAGRALDLAKLEVLLSDPSPVVRVSAAAGVLRAVERAPAARAGG